MTEAEPESETKSKPATRPGVFGEAWDASWLCLQHLTGNDLLPKATRACKGKGKRRIQQSAIAGASETLLAELCISKERSASPS